MSGPFVLPVARSVPFDNTTNDFGSTDVQSAIEESFDRITGVLSYPIQGNYNGNAIVGRHLEVFPGEDTSTAPIVMPLIANLISVVIQATAATSGAISIYNATTATTLYVANFSGAARQIITGLDVSGFNSSDEIQLIVSGAAVNKPKIRVWFQGQA